MTINFPKLVMNPKFRGETSLFALSHVLVQKNCKKKINVFVSITKQHPHVKVAGRSIASEEFIERGETYCYYLYQPRGDACVCLSIKFLQWEILTQKCPEIRISKANLPAQNGLERENVPNKCKFPFSALGLWRHSFNFPVGWRQNAQHFDHIW